MYFSMHEVTHVVSPAETEVPGLGMHFSKQFSWSFCRDGGQLRSIEPGVNVCGRKARKGPTSMRRRALARLVSFWTCCITACLTLLESIVMC